MVSLTFNHAVKWKSKNYKNCSDSSLHLWSSLLSFFFLLLFISVCDSILVTIVGGESCLLHHLLLDLALCCLLRVEEVMEKFLQPTDEEEPTAHDDFGQGEETEISELNIYVSTSLFLIQLNNHFQFHKWNKLIYI